VTDDWLAPGIEGSLGIMEQRQDAKAIPAISEWLPILNHAVDEMFALQIEWEFVRELNGNTFALDRSRHALFPLDTLVVQHEFL
jgi:hypothetical protein